MSPYFLRLAIGADALAQLSWPAGVPGVTMSSRIGTAAAHGHRWGRAMFWLLDRVWPFGRNPTTGESHCRGAIRHDVERAAAAIRELLGDPVVVEAYGLQSLREQYRKVLDA